MAINLAPMAVELSLKNKTNGDSFPILALGHLFSKQGTFERRDVILVCPSRRGLLLEVFCSIVGQGDPRKSANQLQQNPATHFILLNRWP
jgi:hypothetical protein